ncbi:uncharacterized protein Dwil_GK17985 [Drosophila willistoni]|uniref:Uncharacterized protein n=1 Tax=Drosophila willistoni TaxID=7260 RepID=B4N620_DROWI|nr:uncharacterized protein Dwil_GK17985 [Drosophila willistoni]
MQIPLLHRYTQLMMLKKQIKHKDRRLKKYKRAARARWRKVRQIRSDLLEQLRQLIDTQQKNDAKLKRVRARHSSNGILIVYKRWLRRWTKSLKMQRQQLEKQQKQEEQWDRRLSQLKTKLGQQPNHKKLVDKCFTKLRIALKGWLDSPDRDTSIEGTVHTWEKEVEAIRKYLMDLEGLKPSTRKRVKKGGGEPGINGFSLFWDMEVQGKKSKWLPLTVTPRQSGLDDHKFWEHSLESQAMGDGPRSRDRFPKLPGRKHEKVKIGTANKDKHSHRIALDSHSAHSFQTITSGTSKVTFSLDEMKSQEKYKPIQNLLKNTIEQNSLLKAVPDSRALMRVVEKHHMWKNLNGLHDEMESAGFSVDDMLSILKDKYMQYLNQIVSDVVPQGDVVTIREQEVVRLRRKITRKAKFEAGVQYRELKPHIRPWGRAPVADDTFTVSGRPRDTSISSIPKLKSPRISSFLKQVANETEEEKTHIFDEIVSQNKVEDLAQLDVYVDETEQPVESFGEEVSQQEPLPQGIGEQEKASKATAQDGGVQALTSDEDCSECGEILEQDQKPCTWEKCPRCGVEVAIPENLSAGSIEACAKSNLIRSVTKDICLRCGYIHKKSSLCPHLACLAKPNLLSQLQRIKAAAKDYPETKPRPPKEYHQLDDDHDQQQFGSI